jgi:hypothetical protein
MRHSVQLPGQRGGDGNAETDSRLAFCGLHAGRVNGPRGQVNEVAIPILARLSVTVRYELSDRIAFA